MSKHSKAHVGVGVQSDNSAALHLGSPARIVYGSHGIQAAQVIEGSSRLTIIIMVGRGLLVAKIDVDVIANQDVPEEETGLLLRMKNISNKRVGITE